MPTVPASRNAQPTRHPNFPIPGGPELRAKGWRQEGLLRLLENVLAVGEDPEKLIVYAALGKAARNWAAHEAIVRSLTDIEEDETLIIQSGKPMGLLKTHAKAPLVIMANCNIVGTMGQGRGVLRARAEGPDLLGRPDRRGLAVYRQPGRHPGHLRDLHAHRRTPLRRRPVRPLRPDGRTGWHGRRAAAGRPHGRRCDPRASTSTPSGRGCARRSAISTHIAPDLDTALAMIDAGAWPRSGRPPWRWSAMPPRSTPRSRGAASCPTSSPTRPRPTTSSMAMCPRATTSTEVRAPARSSDPEELIAAEPRLDRRGMSRPCSSFQQAGRRGLRQRQSDPHAGKAGRGRERLRHPDLHRSLSAAAVRPCHRPVPLDGAVGRAGRHRQDRRPACCEMFPDNAIVTNWIRLGARERAVRRPAGAHRLARPWRAHRTGAGGERAWSRRASLPGPSPSRAIISTQARWRIPTS